MAPEKTEIDVPETTERKPVATKGDANDAMAFTAALHAETGHGPSDEPGNAAMAATAGLFSKTGHGPSSDDRVGALKEGRNGIAVPERTAIADRGAKPAPRGPRTL